MQRTVDGPAEEWLSRTQAAKWMNIGHKFFDVLVAQGVLPKGVKMSHKVTRWHWLDIFAASQTMRWRQEGRIESEKIPAHEPS